MTFKDVAIKNFKGNIKKYLVYLLGNSFIVASYFIFINMLKNVANLSENIEDGILEGFIIPIVAITIFTIVFIIYSHMTFINQRKKEFGIFMNLGMSISNIRKLIIIENLIIAGASIIAGLIVGIVFSRLLYLVLLKVIEIDNIHFSLTVESFALSIVIFLLLNFLSLIATIVETYKFNIIDLLKSRKKVMGRNKNNFFIFILGVAFFSIAIFLLYKGIKMPSIYSNYYVLLGMILIYYGPYLIISNVGSFLIGLVKKNKKIYYKNILWITQVDSKFKENRYIIIISVILVSISLVYLSTAFTNYNISEKLAINNNTYNISLFQVEDRNVISKEKVDELINENNVVLEEYNEVEVLYYHGSRERPYHEILINEDELREKFNQDINVPKKTYIRLNQFMGMENEKQYHLNGKLTLFLDNVYKQVPCNDIIFKALFRTENNGLNELAILNSEDYKDIRSKSDLYCLGKIKLLNTSNWKNDNLLVNSLKDELNKGDNSTTFYDIGFDIDNVLKVRSKIGSLRYRVQESGFVLFTCGYLGIFFFCAISIILFLKLMADSDGDRERYRSIYKIGIEDKKVKKTISKELIPVYFLGLILGSIIGVIFTIFLMESSYVSEVKEFIKADFIMIALCFLIQIAYYIYSKNKYFNYIKS